MTDKKVVVLGVIKNKEGQILMSKKVNVEKGKSGSKLTWVFPGGLPEEGEALKKALIREILVETGFLASLEGEISARTHPEFPIELHYFSGIVFSGNQLRPIEETYEISEYRWVEPGEIRKLITSDLDPKVAKHLGI